MTPDMQTLNAEMPSSGSQVLNDEDYQQLEIENEKLIADLVSAVQSSAEAKTWLNTRLGRDLRKFIISSKQFSMMRIASPRNDEDKNEAQKDYDTICGVEQFFAQLIQGGKVAQQQLQMKGVN